MWYVIQVIEGNTENTFAKCKNAFPKEIYREMFIPMYESMYKTAGKWYVIRKELFPGYFFVDTNNGSEILEHIVPLSRLIKPVMVGRDFVPITEAEQMLLESLFNNERTIAMSRGRIVDGKCDISIGPLVGKNELIKRVDRHKRIGAIDVSILGETRRVKVGLEITEKIQTTAVSA